MGEATGVKNPAMQLRPRISRIAHALIESAFAIKKRNVIRFESISQMVYLILHFNNRLLRNSDSLRLIYSHITSGYMNNLLQMYLYALSRRRNVTIPSRTG